MRERADRHVHDGRRHRRLNADEAVRAADREQPLLELRGRVAGRVAGAREPEEEENVGWDRCRGRLAHVVRAFVSRRRLVRLRFLVLERRTGTNSRRLSDGMIIRSGRCRRRA
jgi:hypothetical protein